MFPHYFGKVSVHSKEDWFECLDLKSPSLPKNVFSLLIVLL